MRPIGQMWNNCGVSISGDKDVQSILNLSGLDFDVALTDIQTVHPIRPDGGGEPKIIKSGINRMSYRTDTVEELGQVGNIYHIIQNREVVDFLKAVIGLQDSDGNPMCANAKITHLGLFMNGRRCWAAIDLGDSILAGPQELKRYIVMTWSHDGWFAFSAQFSCAHAKTGAFLPAPVRDGKKVIQDSFKIKHTKSAKDRIKIAETVFIAADRYFREANISFERLVAHDMTNPVMQKFLEDFFPSKKEEGRGASIAKNKRERIFSIAQSEDAVLQNTAWAVFHAVAQYETEEAPTRKQLIKNDGDARLHAAFFGAKKTASKLTRSAFEKLMEKVSN